MMSSSCAVIQQVRHGLIRRALPKVSPSVPQLIGPPEMYKISNPPSPLSSSGNPLFDFFYHVVPGIEFRRVIRRLELAWNHDSLVALKLICNLRGVRGTGKSDKINFYAAALWLHRHHPRTLACNVKAFAEFGYFKDLPEILRQIVTKEAAGMEVEKPPPPPPRKPLFKLEPFSRKELILLRRDLPAEVRIQKSLNKGERVKKHAGRKRRDARMKKAVRAFELYIGDANYRCLHDRISDVFAECLVSDLQKLNSGNIQEISFASKWCPSLDSSYDQSTLLCESIARRIFPREAFPEYETIDEAHYTYRIRDRLRKEVLVPLRSALKLPELYMSSNNWAMLSYNQVPYVALKRYRKAFMKHDKKRFKCYRKSIKPEEKKIAAGTLLPHQIIAASRYDCNAAELQWRRMVEDLLKISTLKDSLAICDRITASRRAIEVSVALSLLVSEMSHGPWKGKLMDFSKFPNLRKIEGDNLRSKKNFIREEMRYHVSTDFQKVFDKILQVAVDGNLKEDEMIKRLYVFTEMEFKHASNKVICYSFERHDEIHEVNGDWETDYQEIQKKFRECGFSNVPEIVFWNLEHPVATVVKGGYKGVTQVSGFSYELLKLFVEGDISDINPVALMERAISGKEYDKLVVVD